MTNDNSKTVYLMRHGKSSWDDFDSDHERELLPIGIVKTQKVADFMIDRNIKPDLIISSSAVRAFDTSIIIANAIGYPIENIVISRKLYHAAAEDVFDVIYGLDNTISSIILFGHNPTFTDFINRFKRPQLYNLPTSGFASIGFNTNKWKEISSTKFTFNFLTYPSLL